MNVLRHFLKRPLLGFGLIALACIAAVLVQVVWLRGEGSTQRVSATDTDSSHSRHAEVQTWCTTASGAVDFCT